MYYRPLPPEVGIRESKYLSDITGRSELGLFANTAILKGTKWMTHKKTSDPVFEDGLVRLPMGGFLITILRVQIVIQFIQINTYILRRLEILIKMKN